MDGFAITGRKCAGQLDGTIPSTDDGQQNAQDTLIDGSAIDLSVMGEFNH